MFKRVRNKIVGASKVNSRGNYAGAFIGFEVLEDRRLMSASSGLPVGGPGGPGGPGAPGGGQGNNGPGGQVSQIAFSLIPTAAQTELDSLVTAAGLTDPTSTTSVQLGNVNGVETYSVTINGTGTVSTFTSDPSGNPVTQPTVTTTTWATLDGSGTGSDSAAASEIAAIVTALDLTAPSDDTVINVVTASDGTTTYSLNLSPSSSSSTDSDAPTGPGVNITVFANGDPAGNQTLPFSVIPSTIQNALNANAPSGATALSSDSTQNVQVQTVDGVTLYSTTFTSSGTTTTVTINGSGTLTSLPTHTTTTFSTLTATEQTDLQTLATAEGDTGTISSSQSVDVLAESNGTTLFSITVPITFTDQSGNSDTHDETLTIDSSGYVTVLPGQDVGLGFGRPGGGGGQGQCPPGMGQGGGIGQGQGNSGGSDSGSTLPTGDSNNQGGTSSGTDDGSGDSGTCPTPASGGTTPTSSSSDSSSSSSSSAVSTGVVVASSSDSSGSSSESSSKKSSKKTAKNVVVKATSTKKAKKASMKKKS